jgi:sugar phosphate isomerase/epimerase
MFKNLSCEPLGISPSMSETIELALSNGFKGLDIDLADFGKQVESRGMAACRRLIDSAKLKIGGFRLPVDWDRDDAGFKQDLDKLAALARLAKELDCTRATTHLIPASDERPYYQNFETYRRRLSETAAVLAPHGVRLGVGFLAAPEHRRDKNFQFIAQFDQLQMLLTLVGNAAVGAMIDLWDLHVSGGSLDGLKKLSPQQVVSVRIADFPADVDLEAACEEHRLLPGESGAIDTCGVLVWLAESGYDGPVTPYPHPGQFSNLRRDEIGRKTGAALDKVWTGAGLNRAGKLSTVSRPQTT